MTNLDKVTRAMIVQAHFMGWAMASTKIQSYLNEFNGKVKTVPDWVDQKLEEYTTLIINPATPQAQFWGLYEDLPQRAEWVATGAREMVKSIDRDLVVMEVSHFFSEAHVDATQALALFYILHPRGPKQ